MAKNERAPSIRIPRWSPAQLRETTSRATAFHYLATLSLLKNNAPHLVGDFNKIFATNKGYFVDMAPQSPLELAMGLAQAEQNMFGSKMSVRGDENSASVIYKHVSEWQHVESLGTITDEDRHSMMQNFYAAMVELGSTFEFITRLDFSTSAITVTFSRAESES